MAQFSIRPARPEDCGTILELIRGIAEYEKMSDEVVATEETIRHAMFDEHVTRCLLAELDGKVIGYALYFYNYSTFIGTKGLYLEDLFLYPEYRKAGYGKRLIRELFKIAAAENCGRMEWCCLNWNTPSQDNMETDERGPCPSGGGVRPFVQSVKQSGPHRYTPARAAAFQLLWTYIVGVVGRLRHNERGYDIGQQARAPAEAQQHERQPYDGWVYAEIFRDAAAHAAYHTVAAGFIQTFLVHQSFPPVVS